MLSYRRRKRIPTELTLMDRYPRNYLFKPSKAFARIEKMDKSWLSQVRRPGNIVLRSPALGKVTVGINARRQKTLRRTAQIHRRRAFQHNRSAQRKTII